MCNILNIRCRLVLFLTNKSTVLMVITVRYVQKSPISAVEVSSILAFSKPAVVATLILPSFLQTPFPASTVQKLGVQFLFACCCLLNPHQIYVI